MGKLNADDQEEKPPKSNCFTHFCHDHPLELTALISESADRKLCSGCMAEIAPGRNYYTCRPCDFSLHHACFNMPRSLQHPADPDHDLHLLLFLPSSFHCKACGSSSDAGGGGHGGFAYGCSICRAYYHPSCTQLPPTKLHPMHPHTLQLEFSPPYGTPKAFRCDICQTPGSDHWLYRCGWCEFDAHLHCAAASDAGGTAQKQLPPPSQSPLLQPAYNNNVKAVIAPQSNYQPCDPSYGNQNQMTHQNGSYMSQQNVQNVPMNPAAAAAGTPTYIYPSNPMRPNWVYVNQHGFNQGGGVPPAAAAGGMVPMGPPGMGYPNQYPAGGGGGGGGGGLGRGMAGVGMGGLAVAAIGTGMGEAAGQGIFHSVTGGFGNDGSDRDGGF